MLVDPMGEDRTSFDAGNERRMRSLIVGGTREDPQLFLKELPAPLPAEGEVRIRICGAGVIPTELGWPSTWTQRSGAARQDTVPSHEFSGTVDALGANVTLLRVGDEVFGMNDWYQNGGLAEWSLASADNVVIKPHRLTHEQSASVPISALTAWQALFDRAKIKPGERVLIHGAAGSVGAFAVQLATHHGAFVVATASAKDHDFVKTLGAKQVIDYLTQPFEEAGSVDVVVDTIGGDTLRRSWSVLKEGGRLVTIASSSESLLDDRSRRAFFIVEPNRSQLSQLASLLDHGTLQTSVKRIVSLADAAGEYLAQTKTPGRGKTVVRLS